jgi:D-psicose/D-tagatose/L-ribulose 3-epimerase
MVAAGFDPRNAFYPTATPMNIRTLAACFLLNAAATYFGLAAEPVASATAPAVPTLPPPVAGMPVGWCIRAKPEVLIDAKSAGFEYVELALQDVLAMTDEEFGKFTAQLQSLGLRALSGYNPVPKELKLVGPDVDQAKLDAHLQRVLARAATLKLTYVILNAGPSWRVPDGFARDQAWTQLVDFGRRFAAAASKQGITVLIEPLRTADSNQLTTIAEAVKLVEAVDRPEFQMMVDYSFITISKDDPNALLAAAGHLRDVHISNPAANRTYPMSDDQSDYATFFRVLKRIGYRGGISVHGGTASFATDAPRAITFLRQKARELAGK